MLEEPDHAQASFSLPIGAVLLLGFAYTNLRITDAVPGFDFLDVTIPRVVITLIVLIYLGLMFGLGPAGDRATLTRLRRWRTLLALSVIGINLLLPTALFIRDRQINGSYYGNVTDWPLQIEAGSAFLLRGETPYGADYTRSEMLAWSEGAMRENPALHHAIHLPVNFLLAAAVLPPWQAMFGWQDARIILIAAFLIVLLVAPRLTRRWEDGHALMIALALNPLLADNFAVGLSDFLLLGVLMLVLWSRQRAHYRLAAALLGVAVATRQFSWLLVPLYLMAELRAAYEQSGIEGVPARTMRDRWLPALRLTTARVWTLPTVALALILPFVVVDPRAFYTDVIAFGSGGTPDAYFIGGTKNFGLSVFVLALGLVPDSRAQFPFPLLQLAVTIPVMLSVFYAQWRANTIQRMLFGYTLVLGGFLFTGRFMHGNYLGFLFAVMILACFVAPTPMAVAQPGAASDEVGTAHHEETHRDVMGGPLAPRPVAVWQRRFGSPTRWRKAPAHGTEQEL